MKSKRHISKKDLGQNFLIDLRMQQRIVAACELSKEDIVLEIGPGQGAITRLIAPRVDKLVCIEKDKDLIHPLSEEFSTANVTIIEDDFLKLDMSHLGRSIKVIGNIPYNISTPIIEKLIDNKHLIKKVYLTVQLEFGERLAARPNTKDYGSLSCFVQYFSDVKVLFQIKKGSFKPIPKVDSCFVCLDFSVPAKYEPKDEKLMFKFIRTVFTQRRKNLLNAASSMVDKAIMTSILEDLKLPTSVRPEELSLQNFVDISHRLV